MTTNKLLNLKNLLNFSKYKGLNLYVGRLL